MAFSPASCGGKGTHTPQERPCECMGTVQVGRAPDSFCRAALRLLVPCQQPQRRSVCHLWPEEQACARSSAKSTAQAMEQIGVWIRGRMHVQCCAIGLRKWIHKLRAESAVPSLCDEPWGRPLPQPLRAPPCAHGLDACNHSIDKAGAGEHQWATDGLWIKVHAP